MKMVTLGAANLSEETNVTQTSTSILVANRKGKGPRLFFRKIPVGEDFFYLGRVCGTKRKNDDFLAYHST